MSFTITIPEISGRYPEVRENDRHGRASADKTKFSYGVLRVLHETGYDMIPVNPNPKVTEIRGIKVYDSLESIDRPVDMVEVFRPKEELRHRRKGDCHRCESALGANRGLRRPRGEARRGRRPQGGDEPLPEDRAVPSFLETAPRPRDMNRTGDNPHAPVARARRSRVGASINAAPPPIFEAQPGEPIPRAEGAGGGRRNRGGGREARRPSSRRARPRH